MEICELIKERGIFELDIRKVNGEEIKKSAYVSDYLRRGDINKILEYGSKILNSKRMFKRLINEYKTLSDKEFFYLSDRFYSWKEDEIINALCKNEIPNPVEYVVKTTDIINIRVEDGHGRDWSWWTEYYYTRYKLTADESIKIDEEKVYTKQEIADLVNTGKVIAEKTHVAYGKDLGDLGYKKSKELNKIRIKNPAELSYEFSCHNFSYTKRSEDRDIEELNKISRRNRKALKVIHQYLTKEKLLKDYKEYLEFYNISKRDVVEAIGILNKRREEEILNTRKNIIRTNLFADKMLEEKE